MAVVSVGIGRRCNSTHDPNSGQECLGRMCERAVHPKTTSCSGAVKAMSLGHLWRLVTGVAKCDECWTVENAWSRAEYVLWKGKSCGFESVRDVNVFK
ncbi:hypothetical protein BDW22DRAFT_1363759 [Trametopsis cervina]|nr:hypothetical protein BDW22DRAFT_1363759 [Trametopsis cervina]